MKKSFLLLITLIVSIVSMANPVTPDEARQKITKFMNPRRAGAKFINPDALKLVETGHYKAQSQTFAPCFYVFSATEGEGYVIAGADDRIPSVLGYSLDGKYNPNNIPENMKAWLQSYNDQMAYLNQHPEAAVPRRTVQGDAIAPLLDTRYTEGPIAWDQGMPYNNLCPLDEGEHSLTGCVATAMAQIMYYWKYPAASTDLIPGYITESKKIQMPDIPARTAIDWANMLPQYKGKETDVQKQAIANLMLMCGTSVYMDYSNNFSGAWGGNVAIALRSYFDYDLATSFKEHAHYRATEWNQMVYDELKAGRPVYYDGSSSGSGHAFVVDGYGGDDYFHVNWGWGGSSNDYFLLSILNSGNNTAAGATQSADGYSFDQGAIFGAQPNTGQTPAAEPILTTFSSAFPEGTTFTRESIDENFKFSVGFSFKNTSNDTIAYVCAAGLFTTEGEYLGKFDSFWGTLKPSYYFAAEKHPFTIEFGKGIDFGVYIVIPMSQIKGTETIYPTRCSDIYNAIIVINGNNLTLIGSNFGLTGTLEATGKKEVGSPMPITATIVNKGTEYLGEIFFTVDGKMIGGRHFDLAVNNTAKVEFTFTPDGPGKKDIAVCTRSWNNEAQKYDYTPFIADSITIESAAAANLTLSHVVENAVEGVVKENVIKFKVNAKNNGTTVYDNIIKVIAYKDKRDGSGYYDFAKEISKNVKIEAGGSVDVDFTFDNLEDNRYFFSYFYLSEGSLVEVKSPVYKVQTREPDPVPVLSTVSKTINAIKENGVWTIKTDTAYVSVQVKNTGTVDYNDDITVKLYQLTSETGGPFIALSRTNIHLAAGRDTTIVMQFPGLENNATYFYWTYYLADGNLTPGSKNTPLFTVNIEEKGYYLVSDLNGWSTTDQSYPFTKLDDGKTWEITFNAPEQNIWMKIAPATAYNYNGDDFWGHLLGAPTDSYTELTGSMVLNGGAWMLPTSRNAETYTMRIVPSEMTFTITYTEKEKPFEPVAPFYYVGDNTGWNYDPAQVFTHLGDSVYTYTFKPTYTGDVTWFKIAPSNAISSTGEISWGHLYCPNNVNERTGDKYTGTLVIADVEAWTLSKTDEAESYTVTIDLNSKTYVVEPNKSTGIRLVDGQQGVVTIYDMKGNKVAEAKATDLQQRLKSLPKGIYIMGNGKKFVSK